MVKGTDQDASQAQGEGLPVNAVDDQGFSDAECNAVLIDGYARDADRKGWRATGDALRRAAGFIRGYDALTAKAPAPGATAQDGVSVSAQRLAASMGGRFIPNDATPTPTIPAGMVAEPDPFDDCLGIHVQANARRFAAAPKQAEQQGVERARALWQQACVGREGYCSSDLQDAAITAIGNAFREAEAAARSATLPAHFQWSEGNREKFDFGRDSAADAIAALNAPTGAVEKGEGM